MINPYDPIQLMALYIMEQSESGLYTKYTTASIYILLLYRLESLRKSDL